MADVRITQLLAPTFWPVHRDVRAKGHAEYWLMGGRGSTKSSFVSLEIVLGILTTPEANAIVYRRVKDTLRGSVYEEIKTAIDRLGVTKFFDCRLSPMEIIYRPTGQRILFRGADDPAKSKSIKLSRGYFGFLWFEEASEFQGPDAIRTIKASIIRGSGSVSPSASRSYAPAEASGLSSGLVGSSGASLQRPRCLTFYSYNPPIKASAWVNKAALVPTEGRLVHASTYLDVPTDWLGEDFIAQAEALRATNERAYRHMYLGEVTGSGGQVFDNLEIRAIKDAEIAALDRFFCGLDFGFAVDPDAFTRWAYERKSRTLWAVGEFYGARNSADALADRAKALAGGAPVRCDSADPRMIAELTRRGVRAVGVKKGPGSVEHGVRWLQDLGRIIIDPARTPNIAREFRGYEYETDKDGNFLSEYPDRDNHTIDSARYALEPEIGLRRLGTLDAGKLGL